MSNMTNQSVAAAMISAERERQRLNEGFDDRHDDDQEEGLLEVLAAELLLDATSGVIDHDFEPDSRGLCFKHRDNRCKQLMIAGALVAAAMDRLMRLDNLDNYLED